MKDVVEALLAVVDSVRYATIVAERPTFWAIADPVVSSRIDKAREAAAFKVVYPSGGRCLDAKTLLFFVNNDLDSFDRWFSR